MTKSDSGKTDAQDPSAGVIDSIDELDLKALSYLQLRRLYATLMQAVDNVDEEIKVRSEEDNDGDTVRIPTPTSG